MFDSWFSSGSTLFLMGALLLDIGFCFLVASLADCDATRHLLRRAMVGDPPLPVESNPVVLAWLHNPRIEQPVVGCDAVFVLALVDPPYGRPRGDDSVDRIEGVIAYGDHHILLLVLGDLFLSLLLLLLRHGRRY